MRGNRKRDTKPELLLRRALWRLGLRYRIHGQHLPGAPDVVFAGMRTVVFCDGDFWHGRSWRSLRRKLMGRANAAYWVAKIGSNRARDARHVAALRRAGWRVIRLWETDIRRDPAAVAAQVAQVLGSACAARKTR
jgi:DNA mismatch endonuclease (patch repair protein)